MEQYVLITKRRDTCYTASCCSAPTQTFDTAVLMLAIIISNDGIFKVFTHIVH